MLNTINLWYLSRKKISVFLVYWCDVKVSAAICWGAGHARKLACETPSAAGGG
jgi:hypothetical protein